MNWLKQWLGGNTPNAAPTEHDLHRAAAALLLEVARTDGSVDDEETQHLIHAVEQRWQLDADSMKDVVNTLEQQLEKATDLFEFTLPLREHWDHESRVKLIEDMWLIAAADGHADVHEEHLIRRVSDLLYVAHSDFIRAKLQAIDSHNKR